MNAPTLTDRGARREPSTSRRPHATAALSETYAITTSMGGQLVSRCPSSPSFSFGEGNATARDLVAAAKLKYPTPGPHENHVDVPMCSEASNRMGAFSRLPRKAYERKGGTETPGPAAYSTHLRKLGDTAADKLVGSTIGTTKCAFSFAAGEFRNDEAAGEDKAERELIQPELYTFLCGKKAREKGAAAGAMGRTLAVVPKPLAQSISKSAPSFSFGEMRVDPAQLAKLKTRYPAQAGGELTFSSFGGRRATSFGAVAKGELARKKLLERLQGRYPSPSPQDHPVGTHMGIAPAYTFLTSLVHIKSHTPC